MKPSAQRSVAWPEPAVWAGAAVSARALASRVRLPVRSATWRGTTGGERGRGPGAGTDFEDHRPYASGDDVRRIDWGAYARNDSVLVKRQRRETNPAVDVGLDLSDSMFAYPAKARRSIELAVLACATALTCGARPRLWFLGDAVAEAGDAAALLDGLPPAARTGAGLGAGSFGTVPWRTGSLRVVVSDCLFPGEPAAALLPLAAGAGGVLLWIPEASEEAEPQISGPVDLLDAESDARLELDADRQLVDSLRAAYRRHRQLWDDAARRLGIGAGIVPAEHDLRTAIDRSLLSRGLLEAGKG